MCRFPSYVIKVNMCWPIFPLGQSSDTVHGNYQSAWGNEFEWQNVRNVNKADAHKYLYHTYKCKSYICVTPSHIFVLHQVIYLCHTNSYICVTPSHISVSHQVIYLCHTKSYICATPIHISVSHQVIYLCHTKSYICVTPIHISVSHHFT